MNKSFIIGRLTKAPELRQTSTGKSVCQLQVAVNRRFKRDETDFFSVIVWNAQGESCAKYLAKGQQVAVIGEMQTRSYEGQDGKKRYVTELMADEVEFLAKPSGSANPTQQDSFSAEMGPILDPDEEVLSPNDELPF